MHACLTAWQCTGLIQGDYKRIDVVKMIKTVKDGDKTQRQVISYNEKS